MEQKKYKLPLVFLSLIFWVFIFINISGDFVNFGGDSSQYIILAESLARGTGYHAINQPGSPSFFYYPPVFPLIISPIIYFFGRNFYLMYLLIAVFGYLSLIFLYYFFKTQAGRDIAFFSTAYLALNNIFIFYSSGVILSEIPYLFFSSFALYAAHKYFYAPVCFGKEAILLILGLIAAYLTRYIGIVLFPATVIFLFFSWDKRKAVFVASSFIAFFILWQTVIKAGGASSSLHYQQLLLIDPYRPFLGNILTNPGFLLLRFIEGINYYAYLTGSIFLPVFLKGFWARSFYPPAVFIVIIYGVCCDFFGNRSRLLPSYFIFYFLLTVLWPFKEGVRFLVPILPFFVYYIFIALKSLTSFLKSQMIARYIFYVPAIFIIFFSNTPAFPIKQYAYQDLSKELKNFIALHLWIKNNIPANSIIAGRKPTLTYFYTGRQALDYPFTLNDEEMKQFFVDNHVDYVIIDEFSQETRSYLLPFLKKYNRSFKLTYRVGNTLLLEKIK